MELTHGPLFERVVLSWHRGIDQVLAAILRHDRARAQGAREQ